MRLKVAEYNIEKSPTWQILTLRNTRPILLEEYPYLGKPSAQKQRHGKAARGVTDVGGARHCGG